MANRSSARTYRLSLLIGCLLVLCSLAVLLRPRYTLRVNSAKQLLASQRVGEASSILGDLVKSYPKSAEVAYLSARVHRKLGRVDEAQRELGRARRLGIDEQRVRLEQVLAEAQSGRVKEAEPWLVQYLEKGGSDQREVCEALVNGYLLNYRFTDAARWLDAWEGDFPEDAQPHFARGKMFEHLQLWSDAKKSYQQAVTLDAERVDIRLHLAATLRRLHEYEDALGQYEYCLSLDDSISEARMGAASCLVALGQFERAESFYRDCLASDPNDWAAASGLGQILLDDGDAKGAAELLRAVVESRPTDLAARYALGNALHILGRRDESQEHLSYVDEANTKLAEIDQLMLQVQQQPDLVEARYQIGVGLIAYASPQDGVGWLRSVLQIDPQHVGTHRALSEYHRETGNEKLATFHDRMSKAPSEVDAN